MMHSMSGYFFIGFTVIVIFLDTFRNKGGKGEGIKNLNLSFGPIGSLPNNLEQKKRKKRKKELN